MPPSGAKFTDWQQLDGEDQLLMGEDFSWSEPPPHRSSRTLERRALTPPDVAQRRSSGYVALHDVPGGHQVNGQRASLDGAGAPASPGQRSSPRGSQVLRQPRYGDPVWDEPVVAGRRADRGNGRREAGGRVAQRRGRYTAARRVSSPVGNGVGNGPVRTGAFGVSPGRGDQMLAMRSRDDSAVFASLEAELAGQPVFNPHDAASYARALVLEDRSGRLGLDSSGRRTVVITGRGDSRYTLSAVRRRASERQLSFKQRVGFDPDHAAMWAMLLGIALLIGCLVA
ncbi:MAG: hypothetical protein ACP5H2_10375 [Solirubrobacteraceae bacterium]